MLQVMGSPWRLSPGGDISVLIECVVWYDEQNEYPWGPALKELLQKLRRSFRKMNFTGISRMDWNWEKLKIQNQVL